MTHIGQMSDAQDYEGDSLSLMPASSRRSSTYVADARCPDLLPCEPLGIGQAPRANRGVSYGVLLYAIQQIGLGDPSAIHIFGVAI